MAPASPESSFAHPDHPSVPSDPRQSPAPATDDMLELLTTERCVPTQAWPTDASRDRPYLRVIANLLLELGGGCTISKLRSILKSRLNLDDSVKSVPLKAFLFAYSANFVITRNRVTLARAL